VKIKTVTSNLHTDEQPFNHTLLTLQNHSQVDYVTCIANGCYLEIANTSRKQESTEEGVKKCHVPNNMNGIYHDGLREEDHDKNSFSGSERGGKAWLPQ
jgi:hypothetical protein